MAPKARRRTATSRSGHRTGAAKKTRTTVRLPQPYVGRRARLPAPLPSLSELTANQRDVRARVFHAVSLYRRSIAGKLDEPVSLNQALRRAGRESRCSSFPVCTEFSRTVRFG
jgi:hypothetical protein